MFNNPSDSPRNFTFFWPAVVLLVALVLSYGTGAYSVQQHRAATRAQYARISPDLDQAQHAQDRFVALMRDLLATSKTDPLAAACLRDAEQAGFVRGGAPQGATATGAPVPSDAAPAPAIPATP